MLDEYTTAFARYLRTGTVGGLPDFCAEGADPTRLRIYRNGFVKACVEALRASYPSVDRLVGKEGFQALARPYVEAYPPHVASLVEYGEDFPRFIEDTRETHRLDSLGSFATLDRAWSEVCFAEDAPAATEAIGPAGASGDAEALMVLRGRLAPWVRLVSLDHCALHAWSRLRQGGPGQRIEVRRAPQQVLIWRRDAEILYRAPDPPEYTFIARIAAGRPCGEAAGAAVEAGAEFDLVATFASLLHHRILSFGHRTEQRPGGPEP